MSKSKIVAMVVHMLDYGITMSRYYSMKKPDPFEGYKVYWDDERRVCLEISGKTYRFALVEDEAVGVEGRGE